jgi:protein OS-9
MTDTIIFVKEAKTCSYVLVIHTPRLCGEPGFKSPLDSREEAIIRCREIIDSDANIHADQGSLPEADQPYRLPRHNPRLPLGATAQKETDDKADDNADKHAEEEALNAMIQRAVKALASNEGLNLQDGEIPTVITDRYEDEGLVLIDIPLLDDLEYGVNALADALRAAGFDIKGEKKSSSKVDDENPQEEHDDGDSDGTQPVRDEL